MKNPTLNRRQFKAWLMEWSKEHEEVGESQSSTSCPIATYVYETCPTSRPSVGSETVAFYDTEGKRVARPLPPWARKFVYRIDNSLGHHNPVPVAKALDILADVEQALILERNQQGAA